MVLMMFGIDKGQSLQDAIAIALATFERKIEAKPSHVLIHPEIELPLKFEFDVRFHSFGSKLVFGVSDEAKEMPLLRG